MSRKVSALESLLHNGDIDKILASDDLSDNNPTESTSPADTSSHAITPPCTSTLSVNEGTDLVPPSNELPSKQESTIKGRQGQDSRVNEEVKTENHRNRSRKTKRHNNPNLNQNLQPSEESCHDTIIELDPSTVRPWQFADRPVNEIAGIEELSDDIKHNGQSTPILVRPLARPDGQIKYEYIFGCRRLSACRLAGVSVKAILMTRDALSDARAFALMFGENEQRENISSWARSISFQNILNEGVYKSKRELSLAIGRNESYIKNLTAYSKIPLDVANAIGPMSNISINTAQTIESLARDPKNSERLIELAEQIREGLSPKSLRDKVLGRQRKSPSQRYSSKNGSTLLLTQTNDGGLNIKVAASGNSPQNFDKLAEVLLAYLEEHSE